jgi:hypothetical protein
MHGTEDVSADANVITDAVTQSGSDGSRGVAGNLRTVSLIQIWVAMANGNLMIREHHPSWLSRP